MATASLSNNSVHVRLLQGLGLMVGVVLLLIAPLNKPIWIDEIASIGSGQHPLVLIATGQVAFDQPPLHFLVLHASMRLFGDNLAVFRFISALPGAVALWYVYLLGRQVNLQVGLLALWLTALSPGLILFERMARYHGLLTMLSTMSIYYGLAVLREGRRRDIAAYVITTFLMLMTYYLSAFVIVAQLMSVLFRWRQEQNKWRLLGAMAGAIGMFLPWLIPAYLWATSLVHLRSVEERAISLGVGGFIRRVALPMYAFCFGETLYPWNWGIMLIGVPCFLVAFVLGVRSLYNRSEFLLPITCIFVVLFSALLTSGKFGTLQTVGSMTKRVSFAMPLFYLTLASGVFSLSINRLKIASMGCMVLISLYSVYNYWLDRQFLNPGYIARWDQAIDLIQKTHLNHDTKIYSMADPAFNYYLDRLPQTVRHEKVENVQQFWHSLKKDPVRFIWIVGRDRGNRIAVEEIDKLSEILPRQFKRIGQYGVMPRSDSERLWLQKVLKRPTRPNYIWLELYDTADR